MFNQSTLRLYDISPCYAPSFTLCPRLAVPFSSSPAVRWNGTFRDLPGISEFTAPRCLTFDTAWSKCVCQPTLPLRVYARQRGCTYWPRYYRSIESGRTWVDRRIARGNSAAGAWIYLSEISARWSRHSVLKKPSERCEVSVDGFSFI